MDRLLRFPHRPAWLWSRVSLWQLALLLFWSMGALIPPAQAQEQRTLGEIEATLSDIQERIREQEGVLKSFTRAYIVLDSAGAAREGRPPHSGNLLMDDEFLRYTSAQILTLPPPYDGPSLVPIYFDQPQPLDQGQGVIRTLGQLRDFYNSLADRIPGVLAEIRRLDGERVRLEAERTTLWGYPQPLTQGPDRGSRTGGFHISADSLVAEGSQLLTVEDYQGAKEKFHQAILQQPDHLRAFLGRGIASYALGDGQAAAADLDQAIHLDPRNGQVYYWRGVVRQEALFLEEQAVKDFWTGCELLVELACRSLRELAMARDVQGGEAYQRGDYHAAIRLFSEAMKIDPRYPDAWFNRGLAWDKLGYPTLAIQDFSGYILHEQNAQAYSTARPIPPIEPDQAGVAEAHLRIGIAYLNLGEPQKALPPIIQAIQQARQVSPERVAEFLYYGGLAHKGVGNRQDALDFFISACDQGNQPSCQERDQLIGGSP